MSATQTVALPVAPVPVCDLPRPGYREIRHAPACDFPVRDEILRQFLRLPALADVLEIGPGPGFTAFWVARRVRRLTLVDHAAQTIERLARRLASLANIDLLCWDVARPGLAAELGRRVDAVFGLDVFEYVRDPAGALANLAALLKERGQMLLTFPNFPPSNYDGVVCFSTLAELETALHDAGFARWNICAVRLRGWAQAVFSLMHDWPLQVQRRLRRRTAQGGNFDRTWSAQTLTRWDGLLAPWLHLYWSLLSMCMRWGGPMYRELPADGVIVNRQLVIVAER